MNFGPRLRDIAIGGNSALLLDATRKGRPYIYILNFAGVNNGNHIDSVLYSRVHFSVPVQEFYAGYSHEPKL